MKAFELFEGMKVLPIGFAPISVTAAGTGDATEVTGSAVDTDGAEDATLLIPFRAALTAGKLLALTVKVAESDDGSSFGSDETLASAVTVASSVAGGTIYSVYKLKINLGGEGAPRKRYLKFKVTPNLDASGTDTATLAGLLALGGLNVKPTAVWAAATA